MIRLALRNIGRSLGHYLPVMVFFAVGWALILIVQGTLKGADLNLQAAYPGSLTGDLVVRSSLKPAWTLFGNEDSLWGDSSLPPVLNHGREVRTLIAAHPQVEALAGVLTGPVLIDQEGVHHRAWVFGVDPREYGNVMHGLIPDLRDSAAWLSRDLDRELSTPRTVRLLYSSGQDFRMVGVPVSGTIDYRIPVTAVEHLMLLDSHSARYLFGDRSALRLEDLRNADLMGSDRDHLFSDLSDVEVAGAHDPLTMLKPSTEASQRAEPEDGVWNFLVLSLRDGARPGDVAASLNRQFAENRWDLEVIDWRTAAGGSALYVQWLQGILAAGLVILLFVGAGSLVNAMTGIVVERNREIGTMRALGASRRIVVALFTVETLVVVAASAVGALALAAAGNGVLQRVRIPNVVLGLFFGSRGIRFVFDPVLLAFEALAMGLLAWAGTWGPLRGILAQGIAGTLEERPS